jgi:hypothetical protein
VRRRLERACHLIIMANAAAIEAFVVSRFGDFAFLLGISPCS